ncbi:MAG: hypothetical protein F6K47_34960 [Symploca sp. SIO2E6]|nr:hypothetical protein [Symploca sp. SIO2E6]
MALLIWQQNSNNLENGDNFTMIQQWWANLNHQKIAWRQRLIPPGGNVREIDWEPQRFDEEFELKSPEIRGITLYWYKPDTEQQRSTTPDKLELDTQLQQLYIYPQSQKELVIRVGIPQIIYQKIELTNPQCVGTKVGENYILLLRDKQQQIEIKLTLSPSHFEQLSEIK